MKLLLVNPPWYVFHGELAQPNVPLGTAYVARGAVEAGWSVSIWNGDQRIGFENQYSEEMADYNTYVSNLTWNEHPIWDEYLQVLENVRPDIVGISMSTPAYEYGLECARLAKCLKAKIIAGGPHVSVRWREVLDNEYVNAVVTGPGDYIMDDVLSGVMGQNDKLVFDGLNLEMKNNWPMKGAIYDFHGTLQQDHFGLLMMNRGCPFSCRFCASWTVWGRKAQRREPDDVVLEMVATHNQYGTRYFSFQDDTFTLNTTQVDEVCDGIVLSGLTEVPGFRWTCNTRPELLNEFMLFKMKEAGCAAVAIGIEFGSERMLKHTNKAFNKDDVRRAVEMIRNAGMLVSGQFMVGYPTETEEEMLETAKFADELACDSVMLSVATPLPDTSLYYEALTYGLLPDDINWREITTKNDGILMTEKTGSTYHRMREVKRRRILENLHNRFDDIQLKTLDRKIKSRQEYESQYKLKPDQIVWYGGIT